MSAARHLRLFHATGSEPSAHYTSVVTESSVLVPLLIKKAYILINYWQRVS